MPSCTIIVTTRNRARSLRRTLNSLGTITIPPGVQTELLIVDNGSSDATAEIVAQSHLNMPVRYIHEPLEGQARARNTGLKSARSDAIVFVDDDVVITSPATWLAAMCVPILSGAADGVVGGVRLARELCRPWMTVFHRSYLADTERLQCGASLEFVGANMAFSRRVLEKVPAFDTELGPGALGFGDDSLFAWQIVEAGFRLQSAFESPVEHHPDPSRLSRKSFIKTAQAMGRVRGYLAYHWSHERLGWQWLYLIKRSLRLAFWRITRWPFSQREGAPEWELKLLTDIHSLRYYVLQKLLCRPRKYEKRGLVKLV